MRNPTQKDSLERLMEIIGARAKGPGKVYFVGGATAVLLNLRKMTKDVDLKLEPEPSGVFEAIRDIKEELEINIELASPDHFLPPVPGWVERSRFIATHGPVDFFHYDPVGQALSKVSRGHSQDLEDVRGLAAQGWINSEALREGFDAIFPELIRYPAIEPTILARKVEAMAKALENASSH